MFKYITLTLLVIWLLLVSFLPLFVFKPGLILSYIWGWFVGISLPSLVYRGYKELSRNFKNFLEI